MGRHKNTVIGVHSYCNLLIGLMILNGVGYDAAEGFFIDYKENSELIQQPIGYNITLQCNLEGLVDETKTAQITYNWYFKQCGEGSGGVANCYDTNDNEDWTQLPCQYNTCKSELHLKNVTEKYSGLYKCTVVPKIDYILDVKLVRKFQLDIKNASLNNPEFLDADPVNKTTNKGSQVTFQCRVLSEEYPTIKWFRRLPNLQYGNYENIHSVVYYNGLAYELLTTSPEKSTSRYVYISKLFIDDVDFEDEGFYACVAITFLGHNIREAYLKVNALYSNEDLTEYWSDYDEETDLLSTSPKEFWLLFLMPVGLALLPLSVWLCYIIHKRYQNYSLSHESKYLEESDQRRMLKS